MVRWADIPGYEGLYKVSDDGQVLGLKRGRIMADTVASDGYHVVSLSRNNRQKQHPTHRLMCMAFYGVTESYQMARHLDDNRDNNVLSNLAWGTAKDNAQDALRNGRHHGARKTECKRGHPFDESNTAITAVGTRLCKRCDAMRSQKKRDRKKGVTT